jgi:hypothetical protein
MAVASLIFSTLQIRDGINPGNFPVKIPYFIENIYFGVGIGVTGSKCALRGMDGRRKSGLDCKQKRDRVLDGKVGCCVAAG